VTFHVLVDGEGGIDMPLDHMGIISTHAWDIIICSFKVVVWPPLTPKIARISVDIFPSPSMVPQTGTHFLHSQIFPSYWGGR
jgi:hypothetical protein